MGLTVGLVLAWLAWGVGPARADRAEGEARAAWARKVVRRNPRLEARRAEVEQLRQAARQRGAAGVAAKLQLPHHFRAFQEELADDEVPFSPEALTWLREVLTDPAATPAQKAEAQVGIGDVYASWEQGAAARAAYEQAQRDYPRTPAAARAAVRRADLMACGPETDLAAARAGYEAAARMPQADAATKALAGRRLGDVQREQGDLAAARATYEAVIREYDAATDPAVAGEVAEARWRLALTHGRERNWAAAVAALEALLEDGELPDERRAVRHATWREWALFQKALALRAAGQSGAAARAFEELIRTAPDSFLALRAEGYRAELRIANCELRIAALERQRAQYLADLREYGCGAIVLSGLARMAGRGGRGEREQGGRGERELGRAGAGESGRDSGGNGAMGGRPITPAEVARMAGVTVKGETSLAGLVRAAEALGLPAVGLATDEAGLERLDKPLLAWVRTEESHQQSAVSSQRSSLGNPQSAIRNSQSVMGGDHFALVTQMGESWVRVLDPAAGELTMAQEEFGRRWAGRVLAVGERNVRLAAQGVGLRRLAQAEMRTIRGSMNRGWQGHQTYHKPRQIPGGPEEAKGPGEVDFTVLPGLYNNLFIGMPLVTRQEFRVPTRGWPLEFTLVYQHANPSNHAGGAWLHSYDRWVEASSSSTLAYVWGGWGLQTKFLQNVDGTFTSEAGKHETLEELENAQQEVVGYRVTQKDGTIWEYKVWDDVYNRWCLSRLADRYGNSTRLVYDGDTGRVTEVIAPDGGPPPGRSSWPTCAARATPMIPIKWPR
jgi:hypothetical protein